MKVLGVIPARFGAQRFPGKPLADIAGKSLVQRVWERASQCASLDALVVATEDQRIVEHVASFGGEAVMTSPEHASGTDRLGEVAAGRSFDYYVNIQGDEPLLDYEALDSLIRRSTAEGVKMSTLITPFPAAASQDELEDSNSVKVVLDAQSYALYFSRSRIPYPRNAQFASYYKHIGIYMYSRETLAQICAWPPTDIERAESLEQLRALYNGIRILAVECTYDAIAVDVPSDIDRVLARLANEGAA